MKLANIYVLADGAVKGQAATGSTDSGCLNVKAYDGAATRDIQKIVSVDESGNATVISRRLTTQTVNDYKYVSGQLTCTDGKSFNDYCEDSAVWGVTLTFKIDSLIENRVLAYNMVTNAGWQVYINTSGHVCAQNKYSGTAASAEWTNWTISAGVWYTLDIYGHSNKSSTVYCSVNGSAYVSKTLGKTSLYTNARNLIIGAVSVNLRGQIKVRGTNYSSSSTTVTFDANIENGTAGAALSLTSNGRTLTGGTIYQHTESTYVWTE